MNGWIDRDRPTDRSIDRSIIYVFAYECLEGGEGILDGETGSGTFTRADIAPLYLISLYLSFSLSLYIYIYTIYTYVCILIIICII